MVLPRGHFATVPAAVQPDAPTAAFAAFPLAVTLALPQHLNVQALFIVTAAAVVRIPVVIDSVRDYLRQPAGGTSGMSVAAESKP